MEKDSVSGEIWVSTVRGAKRSWVAAMLCGDINQHHEYIKQYPEKFRKQGEVHRLKQTEFPIFIIEKINENPPSLSFVSRADLDSVIRGISRDLLREFQSERGDFTYLNIYRVTAEWTPSPPGSDHMGELNHLHVDGEALNTLANEGWSFYGW